MERALAGRDRTNRMLDAYGMLLTPRQRQFLIRYYQDDLSLGEIALQMRISRQAVHDGLRRALEALERFEAALGLVARTRREERSDRIGTMPQESTSAEPPRTDHYSNRIPQSRLRPRVLHVQLHGRRWAFQVAGGVFAARGLDAGTRLLIETMRIGPRDRILDLGCGYGPIGLVAAALAPRGQAWLIDTNQRAAALALANAAANNIRNARVIVGEGAAAIRDRTIDVVVTNPPIREGRRVVTAFIDDARRVLRPGGRFYLVARTAQGARTLARLMTDRFEQVEQVRVASGYRVYEATRGASSAVSSARDRQAGGVKETSGV
ncbi:MAG: methyltransferase [Armatimonadetes bacterium]|nr:methyltransferase [Armatimonadota bacterium]